MHKMAVRSGVLHEVDKDEDFINTRVNYENGSLVTSEVEGNNRIIPVQVSTRVFGSQRVNVSRQAGEDGMLEDLDGGDSGGLEQQELKRVTVITDAFE